ncbi:hypothetical protein CS0771_63210 [Catellatospora sp. IY07-71]|uniref:hypothetical protein n=1 Tax=Catellatospora sp. IY07-71 TaxID=2728827 RepID=UPI001BB37BDC|nr:hypothetical protein [Catellatospora sp. IY07-71]BCJ76777.1 hypothetical protein CS0771_63210 [Catellatospora sp. IY07-71]
MTDADQHISAENLAELGSYQLEVARLASLDHALGDAPGLHRHALFAGAEPRAYADELLGRREERLSALDGYRTRDLSGLPLGPSWRERDLDGILDQLAGDWHQVRVPRMVLVDTHLPNAETTDGFLRPRPYPGGVGLDSVHDLDPAAPVAPLAQRDGRGPLDEEHWWYTWQWTNVFEPAPADGFLSYRFEVGAHLSPYDVSALSGGLYAWIRVASASDQDDLLGQWRESKPWPVDVALPRNTHALHTGRESAISGWIPVRQGQRAKLSLLAGVIVALAGGRLLLISHAAGITTHPVGYSGIAGLGRIEYRFDSMLLGKLLDDELDLRTKRFP